MQAELGSRALFPTLEAVSYLNHASVSPPSVPVQAAVMDGLQLYARLGTAAFHVAAEQRESLRGRLGELLNVDASALAFSGSTNRGLIDLAQCLAFTEHDRVVVFRREFPANVTPWRQAVRRAGGELVALAQEGRTDAEVLEDLEQTLKQGRVRLVAASAVQFATGRVMPIGPMARLAHAYGAELCVDAIQALGILPFDLQALDVDYVCSGAHKWLMGLEGVGFVYVAPRHQQALRPLTAGWLSHEQPLRFLMEGPGFLDVEPTIRSAPGFLEGHSLNAVGCMALEAGVGLLQQLGVAAIHAHVGRLNDVLETGLVARGFRSLRSPGGGAGTLSVAPPDDLTAIAIAAGLDAAGVSVSAPDGKLRFSPHWPNSEGELEPVLDRLDAVCTALR